MRRYIIVSTLLLAIMLAGCGAKNGSVKEEHTHDEMLQLTAYDDKYEYFIEATPFAKGVPSDLTVYVTKLSDFKPLEAGEMTISLVGEKMETVKESIKAPQSPGIFKLKITPSAAGKACLLIEISDDREDNEQIAKSEITVFNDLHKAQHAAEDLTITSSDGVAFPKEMSWKVNFSTDVCCREPFGQVIKTMAQIEPAQGEERVIVAKNSGIVSIPSGDMVEGKSVTIGQTLLYIEGGELADNNLTVRYKEAESQYSLAKREYERKRILAEDNIVSESDLLQAKTAYETAESIYNNLRKNFSGGRKAVTSSISGYVKQLMVGNGVYVEEGSPIMSISQNKNLFVRAEIPSKYYSILSDVSTAHLKRVSDDRVFTLEELDGRLVSYSRFVSAETPVVTTLFSIKNRADLLPGSFIEMYIRTKGEKEVLTIPGEALIEEMGNFFAYIQLTPVFFEKREIEIGRKDGLRVEVIRGISEGERVVAKGSVLVKLAQASGAVDPHAGHLH
ncbi:MAG: efflux RND transporter periplasmic adaptor subunit [Porphyromonas sp.]|nr:efflux RND transporter periplasmic adaptor subunit [Porphyromonas sp.]